MKSGAEHDLKARTKAFAIRVMKCADALPKSVSTKLVAGQLARCGASVAADYGASQRARSKAEFIAKLSIVHGEAHETLFWPELAEETGLLTANRFGPLVQEAHELTAIFVASLKTAKST